MAATISGGLWHMPGQMPRVTARRQLKIRRRLATRRVQHLGLMILVDLSSWISPCRLVAQIDIQNGGQMTVK
jgi:hypothetical protein